LDSIEDGRWAKKFLVDGFDSRHKLGRANSEAKTKLEAEIRARNERRKQLVEALTDEATRRELAELKSRLNDLNQELATLPPPTKVYAAANDFKPDGSFLPARSPRPVFLLAKGDVKRPGELMKPAGLAAVPGPNPDLSTYLGGTMRHDSASTLRSPSPLPSPSGRGNSSLDVDKLRTASPSQTNGPKFSLSPRERAGVRGKSATENPTRSFAARAPEDWDSYDESARRAALAKWITDPKNMLTRRSIVNRVWSYHFSHGIVETPNDFGHMGALPTH